MIRVIIFIMLILLWCQSILAQTEFTYYVPNTVAAGYGGSQVTNTDNPSIVYWNPGGIAFATTDKILINVNSLASFNYLSFTKFFPPQKSIGFSLSRLTLNENFLDIATVAYSCRITQFFAVGGNINYGRYSKTGNDFISTSLGCLLKPGINRNSFYQAGPSPFYLFVNPSLYDKYAFGIMIHNLPLDKSSDEHEIRIGAAFNFFDQGPFLNFDYHIHQKKNSVHFGVGFNIAPFLNLSAGTINFEKNNLAIGSSLSVGIFETNIAYAVKSEKITISLAMRLKEDALSLSKKYKNQGTKKIRESNFHGALRDYENSLAYNQNNERIIYLTSILKKRVEKENSKIDSLFTEAVHFQNKGWNIYAAVIYKKILEIDKNNKKAKNSIKAAGANLARDIRELFNEGKKNYSKNKLDDAKNKFKFILLAKENHPGAIKYLAKIDSINSHLSNEYYYRGLGYYKQQRLEKSKTAFLKVLEMNPNHTEAKYYLKKVNQQLTANKQLIARLFDEAYSLEKRGKYILASSKYKKILKTDKDNIKAAQQLDLLQAYINVIVNRKFNRAKRLFNKGNYKEAQAAFKDLLSIKPSHKQAKHYLNKIKEAQSDKIDNHLQQAKDYFYNRKWDDALNELEQILAAFPDHHDAKKMQADIMTYISLNDLQTKGLRLFKKGAYINALKIFNQIINKDPGNVIAKSYIAECRSKLSKRTSELFNSGMRFYTGGNYEAAIREWNRILETDPNHQSALEYKKRARERLEALEQLP